jgi:hypothetical protein
MGENTNAYGILVGKPERRRPLRRSRHKWVDNIKMNLREIGWGSMDWIYLDQDWNQWRIFVWDLSSSPMCVLLHNEEYIWNSNLNHCNYVLVVNLLSEC